MLRRAPALGAALVLAAAGLATGYAGSGAGAAALVLGVGALGLLHRARRDPGRALALWIGVTALVGIRLVGALGREREDARAWASLASRGESVVVRAVAHVDAVRETRPGRWSARATLRGCPRPCAGATVRWSGRGAAPREGSRVALEADLAVEPVRGAPGARFPPLGLAPGARRGVLREVRATTAAPPRSPLLLTVEDHLRARIDARFGTLAPLLDALLLGDRGGLDPALADAFAATGTIHLLAVSGLHVGFLAGLLAFGLGLANARPGVRALASTTLLAGYTALVGARPSAARAAAMASLALCARAAERRVDRWQPWGAAAVAILAWRPLDLFDLGYGLSFGSVAGLLALAGPIERRLASSATPEGGSAGSVALARPAALLAAGLAATTAATVATLPIQAAAFGWIAPAGFLLNPLAVPLAAIGLPLAWLALAIDALGPSFVASPVAHAAGLAIGALAALVALFGARTAPWAPGPWGWAAAAVLAAVGATALARRHPAFALGLGGLAAALLLAVAPPRSRALEIVWLDVGQGDAIVLHFPTGATWLVDAGPADPFGDAGRRVVLRYLRRRGIRRIDRFVTTHPDLDHVGGAATVVRGIRVDAWASAGPIDDGPAWLALLAATGPRAETLSAGDRLREGAVAVDVLHPSPEWVARDAYAARLPANEASIVLLVAGGPCRALLTGDLGRPGEAALARALGDSLRADLLHAGHHGSRHSSTMRFLDHVRPRHVVVSAGSSNRHGHPHADALGRFARIGASVWRTDRLGPVAARCGPRGWRLSAGATYLS